MCIRTKIFIAVRGLFDSVNNDSRRTTAFSAGSTSFRLVPAEDPPFGFGWAVTVLGCLVGATLERVDRRSPPSMFYNYILDYV